MLRGEGWGPVRRREHEVDGATDVANIVNQPREKDENEERTVLAEQARTKSVSKDAKVPTSIVTESVNTNTQDFNPVTDYLTELRRS